MFSLQITGSTEPQQASNLSSSNANRISPALQALTTAALFLPGLTPTLAHAADDEVTIQYGHYEEAKRDIYGPLNGNVNSDSFIGGENVVKKLPGQFAPITVDTIHAQAKTTLRDRWKFTANYTEDTWSGATPVATAPAAFGGNQPFVLQSDGSHSDAEIGQTITGATPQLNSLDLAFDAQFNPVLLRRDGLAVPSFDTLVDKQPANQLTHTLTMASPETRKQGDFKLSYEWDEAAVDLGGGLSVENDYESRFVNWGGRLDFNNKLTTLNFSQSYTNSTVSALLDHDSLPYLGSIGYQLNGKGDSGYIERFVDPLSGGNAILHGKREDIATNISLTQVLSKSALAEAGVGYTHSSGFMENPYKATYVFFVDPNSFDADRGLYTSQVTAFTEQRPNKRNQVNLNLRYVQHVEPLDAAMNLKYNYFFDDWGINAHTFEGKWVQPLPWGLTVTPTIRYYSQSAADFYHPFLVLKNAGSGNVNNEADYRNLVRQYPNFSSDHRLSAYGALSGGVVVNKQFAQGLNLEMGFEYYTHQGGLRLGGGGEGGYANFSAYSANAALKVNLDTLGRSLADSSGGHHHHHHRHHQHGGAQPAGLMFGHMLDMADDWMIGYQYMYNRQAGNMLQGSQPIADTAITLNNAARNPNCAGTQCFVTPTDMTMHMHMFMVMYAPTDWLNLMLMPTFMDMSMNMRQLGGIPQSQIPSATSSITGAALNHTGHEHQTGGIGDTNISALVKLYDDKRHHVHMGLGVSAPTGDVDIHLRPNHGFDLGFIHYGMQLGSGTWDFTPSLTYTGHHDDWGWGAQIQGIKRLQNHNESGYRLGDMLQATAWGSYQFLDWLGGTVRGIYTTHDSLHGEYNRLHVPVGTMDTPANHGGKYWDIGMGLNATIPGGDLAGNTFSVEWIQPLQDNVNGVQLEREGALSAKWSYMF
ncbi:DUF3570 domain-containing protein [Methylomonas methanica]|uniref:DUF3570 domain-containing protein n=1 Tax=Methylomonas methanica (strain DSM 25384 / MC09) TaxID=857087 RepID=F9ZZ66_METMM|nr:hypothetical protein Metme_2707 [Methylomonas methanica MC09]